MKSESPSRVWPIQVPILICAAWAVLFGCAAYRHAVFRSTAFDLGIFDQALWQLSHGKGARVSLMGMNIFSDHGAFILYPLSVIYRILASPYALLAVQSLALALGAAPLLLLAKSSGLSRSQQLLVACVYMLHPAVFSANLFDFHPETIGVPLLPLILLLAERRRYAWLALVALAVMSCKEVLALTVSAMGLVICVRGQRKVGAALCLSALAWFVVVTQAIMPGIPDGAAPNAFARYSYLGESFGDKLSTLMFQPWEALRHLPITSVLLYLASLAAPCFWVFSRSSLVFLVACAPTFFLNSLSTLEFQRSLRFQHSLSLVPILAVMAIESLRARGGLPRGWTVRRAVIFAVLALIVPLVARNAVSFGAYPVHWSADGPVEPLQRAVSLVPPDVSVLASSRIVPHLAHRVELAFIDGSRPIDTSILHDYAVIDRIGSRDQAENRQNLAVREVLLASGEYEAVLDRTEVTVLRRTKRP
jgi:uncharacterized membrane protein